MSAEDLARLLRWYPPAWRDRYGEELAAYMEDSFGQDRAPLPARLSLMIGGIRERARLTGVTGTSAAPPDRIRAGTLIVLCSFAVFVFAGSSFAKLSEHFDSALPDGRGAHLVADLSFTTIQVAAAVAGMLVIAGAALALPSFVRFLRSGGWPAVRRHVMRATAWTFVTGGVTIALFVWAHRLTYDQRYGGSPGYEALFPTWAALFAVMLALWTVVAAAAARRVALSRPLLVAEGAFAVAVATAMVVILACTGLWWAAMADHAPLFLSSDRSSPTNPKLMATVGLMAAASATATGGVIRVARSWSAWREA